jgi:hypothetical protein
MKKLAFIAGAVLAGFAVTPADLLFSQTPSSADGFFSDGISTNGSQFYGQAFADNFTLAQQSTVTLIRFWGSSENFVFNDLTNFSAFDIYFYDPSWNVVASGQIPIGSFTTTATGNQNSLGGLEYEFELATNFVLNAGNYQMHVGSINVSPGDDAWAWSEAVGDGNQYFNVFDANGWQSISGDSSFELEGQPVPEPGTMIALGLGAAAFVARRRKKTA